MSTKQNLTEIEPNVEKSDVMAEPKLPYMPLMEHQERILRKRMSDLDGLNLNSRSWEDVRSELDISG